VSSQPNWKLKLLFDGSCPLCVREAYWLQRRNQHGHLAFEDISLPDSNASRYGLTHEQAMEVIHGVYPDGRVISKLEVFRQAYRLIGLGWLLAPTGWPLLRALSNCGYEWFARHRVFLGRLLGGRKCQNGSCAAVAPRGR
jgi:predicted DCC family thiol-disulfide oxidoreductase YuxK